jgi:hypothetical protein
MNRGERTCSKCTRTRRCQSLWKSANENPHQQILSQHNCSSSIAVSNRVHWNEAAFHIPDLVRRVPLTVLLKLVVVLDRLYHEKQISLAKAPPPVINKRRIVRLSFSFQKSRNWNLEIRTIVSDGDQTGACRGRRGWLLVVSQNSSVSILVELFRCGQPRGSRSPPRLASPTLPSCRIRMLCEL